MLGFVIRCGNSFKRAETLLILFNSLVRSQLEYCVVIWNPTYQSHVDHIEWIHRRFFMYLHFKKLLEGAPNEYSYSWTLTKLNAVPFYKRRLYHELVFLYKSVHHIIDSNTFISSFVFYNPSRRTRNTNTFYYRASRTNVGLNSPINRIMRYYNQYFSSENLLNNNFTAFKRYILERLMHI